MILSVKHSLGMGLGFFVVLQDPGLVTITSSPRMYGRIMQHICKKISLKSKLSLNFLANVHYL